MIPKNYSGLILFKASWAASSCASARQILDTALPRHSESLGLIEVDEEDGQEGEEIFDGMGIEAVPCVVKMAEGREIGRVVGADSKALLSLLSVRGDAVGAGAGAGESVSLSGGVRVSAGSVEEIKALVSRRPLMLFIKGTPSEPRCGFTGQLIRLLSAHGLHPVDHYGTFNVLESEPVRQGLKEWSQWPTYPQVYWRGELVGGLDILREMFAGGQMDDIVNELKSMNK